MADSRASVSPAQGPVGRFGAVRIRPPVTLPLLSSAVRAGPALVAAVLVGPAAIGRPGHVVVPGLFAICLEVIGNEQMTLVRGVRQFGGLILTSFTGTRRDKAGHTSASPWPAASP